MDEAVRFLKAIKSSDKTLLITHNDGDGLCSGAIVYTLMKERGVEPDVKITNVMKDITGLEGYDKVIMTDVSPPRVPKDERILIIDHHKRKEKPECPFVNPAFETSSVPSCSALCYRLYEKAGGEKNLKWVALLGSYSDRMLEESLPLIKLTPQEKRTYLIGGQLDPALTRTTLLFLAGYLQKDVSEDILKIMIESIEKEDPLHAWTEKHGKAKHLYRIIDEAEEETLRVIRECKEKTWKDARLVYVHAGKTKYRIKRLLVDYLRLKHPGKVVTVSVDEEEEASFSTRSPGPDLTRIVPEAVKGIPGAVHGGHPGAYGTNVPRRYREKFVENLARALSKPF